MSEGNYTQAVEFVKQQLARVESMYNKKPYPQSKLPKIIEGFVNLDAVLKARSSIQLNQENDCEIRQNQLFISPSEFEDLPPEMQKALGMSESDKAEMRILQTIEDIGGVCSLDVLMVKLFQRFKEVNDRRQLQTKLLRMIKKGILYSVPKKKAVYSLKPIAENQVTTDNVNDEEDL